MKLISAKVDVNQVDKQGRTPLLRAATFNKRTKVMQLLLESGANIDAVDNEMNGALHFAAKKGSTEVANFLLKNGAKPYAFNCLGQVPYEIAPEKAQHTYIVCNICKKPGLICCRHCEVVYYCSSECQKKDYSSHQKIFCKFFKQRATFEGWSEQIQNCGGTAGINTPALDSLQTTLPEHKLKDQLSFFKRQVTLRDRYVAKNAFSQGLAQIFKQSSTSKK